MDPLRPPAGNKLFIKTVCQVRLCSPEIGRPAAAPGIAVQRELGDGKDTAPRIQDGAVHDAVLIVKDPQVRNLFRHVFHIGFRIIDGDADEDHKSGADLPGEDSFRCNGGGSDTLNDTAHGELLSAERRLSSRAVDIQDVGLVPEGIDDAVHLLPGMDVERETEGGDPGFSAGLD